MGRSADQFSRMQMQLTEIVRGVSLQQMNEKQLISLGYLPKINSENQKRLLTPSCVEHTFIQNKMKH